MDGPVGKLIDSVGSIFRGSDILPWCDRDIIAVSPLSPLLLSPRKLARFWRLPPRERPADECRQSSRLLVAPVAAANFGVECA